MGLNSYFSCSSLSVSSPLRSPRRVNDERAAEVAIDVDWTVELDDVAHFAGLHSLVRKADARESSSALPCRLVSRVPHPIMPKPALAIVVKGFRRAFEGAEHGYS